MQIGSCTLNHQGNQYLFQITPCSKGHVTRVSSQMTFCGFVDTLIFPCISLSCSVTLQSITNAAQQQLTLWAARPLSPLQVGACCRHSSSCCLPALPTLCRAAQGEREAPRTLGCVPAEECHTHSVIKPRADLARGLY